MQHVIIGVGPAGVVAAETLRRRNASAAITLIGNETEPPYSRMALPYLLTNKIKESGTYLRHGVDHYDKLSVHCVEDAVVAVHPDKKSVTLQGGGTVAFDRLLIATGSHPVTPPIPGIDLPGVEHCWTLADARKIAKGAAKGSEVVLIGAGFIGCIILESLAKRGVHLTVVEMAGHMVARMMDPESGALVRSWCENKGVAVLTSARVKAIETGSGNGKKKNLEVVLQDGKRLSADLVIAATGVAANTAFLADSGIKLDQGILVDDHLRTSADDIYAAGDVCQGKDFSTGDYTVQAIQPTATEHGYIAAMNMSGADIAHRGSVNMNVLDTMGLVSVSYGLWQGAKGGDCATLCDRKNFRYLCLQFSDDCLVGVQAIGHTQHIGVLRGLIQSKIKLGLWKKRLLKNPLCFMEAYLGTTQAIGHNAGILCESP